MDSSSSSPLPTTSPLETTDSVASADASLLDGSPGASQDEKKQPRPKRAKRDAAAKRDTAPEIVDFDVTDKFNSNIGGHQYDCGVIVVLEEELEGIKHALKEENIPWKYEDTEDNVVLMSATGPKPHSLSFMICFPAIQGQSIIPLCINALGRFNIKAMALIGSSGAIDDKLRKGDVIVAETVDSYDVHSEQLEVEGGTRRRFGGRTQSMNACSVGQWAIDFARLLKWKHPDIFSTWSNGALKFRGEIVPWFSDEPSLKVGEILSGQDVVKSTPYKDILKQERGRDVLSVDTESAMFSMLAHQMWTTKSIHYFVIRGISDACGDKGDADKIPPGREASATYKRKPNQVWAAANAMFFLVRMLSNGGSERIRSSSSVTSALYAEYQALQNAVKRSESALKDMEDKIKSNMIESAPENLPPAPYSLTTRANGVGFVATVYSRRINEYSVVSLQEAIEHASVPQDIRDAILLRANRIPAPSADGVGSNPAPTRVTLKTIP